MTSVSDAERAAQPFRLGVNYWPAQSAMGFWRNFDEVALVRDFGQVKGAGLDSVRLFLSWEDFQPSPAVVDTKMLGLLQKVLDHASSAGLLIMPTLFTGHMSGANWFPAWAVSPTKHPQRFPVVCDGRAIPAEPINWYADEALRAAQTRLASECATTLAGHPALLAWDLGNENSNCMVPDSTESARAWLFSITEALRSSDPKSPITMGLHMEDLEEHRGLTPGDAAEVCDFLTMHGYPGYASFTSGPTDERLLPFLAQLTAFLGAGMPVLFSEFGVPTLPRGRSSPGESSSGPNSGPKLVTESEAADYLHRGLRALQQSGATGAMMWCFSDYAPHLFDGPPFDSAPHERSFGLFRSDGSAKPAVDEIRAFSLRCPEVAVAPRIQNSDFIDLAIDDYYDSPERHLERLFRRYCAALGESSPFSE